MLSFLNAQHGYNMLCKGGIFYTALENAYFLYAVVSTCKVMLRYSNLESCFNGVALNFYWYKGWESDYWKTHNVKRGKHCYCNKFTLMCLANFSHGEPCHINSKFPQLCSFPPAYLLNGGWPVFNRWRAPISFGAAYESHKIIASWCVSCYTASVHGEAVLLHFYWWKMILEPHLLILAGDDQGLLPSLLLYP